MFVYRQTPDDDKSKNTKFCAPVKITDVNKMEIYDKGFSDLRGVSGEKIANNRKS